VLKNQPLRTIGGEALGASLCSPISRSAVLQGFQNNLANVGTPLFERNPALVKKFVALIDGRNA
jgi:hypothetical protein